MRRGTTKFGLWFVTLDWDDGIIYRVAFLKSGKESPVPPQIRQYLAGKVKVIEGFESIAMQGSDMNTRVYREVCRVPYGSTATYGEIASKVGTSPRVVGRALAHNPTPLIIPCHRIISAHGIGGFTPGIEIKEALLRLEGQNRSKTVTTASGDRRG
ncbi:MAG: methylated-DNA--[protein]-cysteine S-methyltransferase [Methanomicrobiales archaeon]|nr:methylated-DNA--[protein]-cysteine S-methyltransferase [Methanomicrobiales archaeon]